MSETKTVRIEISAEQRVRFKQTVVIPVEKWEHIKASPEKLQLAELESLLRTDDPYDWDDLDDVFAEVVDEEGEPVEGEAAVEIL